MFKFYNCQIELVRHSINAKGIPELPDTTIKAHDGFSIEFILVHWLSMLKRIADGNTSPVELKVPFHPNMLNYLLATIQRWKVGRIPTALGIAIPRLTQVFNDDNHPIFKAMHQLYCEYHKLDPDIALQYFRQGAQLTYLLNVSEAGRCPETTKLITGYFLSGITVYNPIANLLVNSINILEIKFGE